jgi:hypothetical protein
MFTLEQWEKYKKWIEEENIKIAKANNEIFKLHYPDPPKKQKFLFWEWEIHPYYSFPLPFYSFLTPSVEGCLDWLLKNKNI